MKKIILALVVFIIILVGWKFLPITQNLGWQNYENTVFGYSVNYPDTIADIHTNNEYSGNDLTDEAEISFAVPGKTTLFGVESDYLTPEIINIFKKDGALKILEERQKLLAMNLKSYSETIRELQVNNPNPYSHAEVGEMKEITFGGKPAFSFSLTNGFKLLTGEYSLGDGQAYNYVITENSKGHRLIVHYLIDSETYPEGIDLAEKMVVSFKVD